MRTTWISAIAALITMLFAHAAPQANTENANSKLDGTWELVEYRYGSTGPSSLPKDLREIKILSGRHFVWVVYDRRKRKPTSVGGGTYTFQSGRYQEMLEFGDARSEGLIGKEQSFRVSIEGEILHQDGVLSSGLNIEETWRRLQ